MTKRRLLVLLPSDPRPSDTGARIRNAGLLRLVTDEFDVEPLVYPSMPPRSTLRRFIGMATSDWPDMATRLWSPAFAARVGESGHDFVQAEGIEMARYLRLVSPERRIYDAHNAEFLLQRRLAESRSGAHAAYSRLQWHRLERFEHHVVRSSRLTLAVSEHDANQLLALSGGNANVRVVPNAIDVAAYPLSQTAQTHHGAPAVLFLGKLDFRPNAEALAWFIPSVLQRLGETRLFAVGAAPPDWLIKIGQGDSRVAVTGHVADERPYFARCAALVLPVRTGGGSRLKALVAMATGLPIVSTRVGMEGLEAEPGTHYLVAESAADWIGSIRRLLGDARLRQHLACNGRTLVEQRYDWSRIRSSVQAAYATL